MRDRSGQVPTIAVWVGLIGWCVAPGSVGAQPAPLDTGLPVDSGATPDGIAPALIPEEITLRHPLAHPATQALLRANEAVGISAREKLADLALMDIVGVDEHGVPWSESSAVEVTREQFRGASVLVEQWLDEPKISAALSEAVAAAVPGERLMVHAALAPAGTGTVMVMDELNVAIAEGRVLDEASYELERGLLIAERNANGAEAIEALFLLVAGLDVVEVSRLTLTPSVVVELPAENVEAFANILGVLRVDLPANESLDGVCDITSETDGDLIDGEELEELLQMGAFYDAGFFGDGVLVGMSEPDASDVCREHIGFINSSLGDRWENCSWFTCTNTHPSSGDDHATAVASVLIGDITLGQDPDYAASSVEALRRSGVARGASGFGVPSWDASYAINKLTDPNRGIDLITRSASDPNEDVFCQGTSAQSLDWDAVYESGFAVFNSTGNRGSAFAPDCSVNAPASAMGVFSVSQYTFDANGLPEMLPAAGEASRGGTVAEGRGRTIVDLAAPTPFEMPYPHYDRPLILEQGFPVPTYYRADWDDDGFVGIGDNNGIQGAFGDSSMATPAVAAAAAVFKGWYRDTRSTLINSPGVLYANMLLMGDRTKEASTGFGVDSEYDSMWGAGKLQMRFPHLGGEGMDAPWGHGTGIVHVQDGQHVFIPLRKNNGAPATIPVDVDVIKIALWFYDDEFDDGAMQDNIDLTLQVSGDGVTYLDRAVSDSPLDEKERIFWDVMPTTPAYWRLKITGTRVQHGLPEALPVYYAFLWEDSDRDETIHECVRVEE